MLAASGLSKFCFMLIGWGPFCKISADTTALITGDCPLRAENLAHGLKCRQNTIAETFKNGALAEKMTFGKDWYRIRLPLAAR